jgi:hypothetical protein
VQQHSPLIVLQWYKSQPQDGGGGGGVTGEDDMLDQLWTPVA